MDYHYSIRSKMSYEEALNKITRALESQGFGIITTIDLKETFRHKLNLDFRKYKILGACNPEFAYRAISLDSHLGLMLPCNIIVQEHENGQTEISAISPLQTLDLEAYPHLRELAAEVGRRLRAAIDDLHADQPVTDRVEALPS